MKKICQECESDGKWLPTPISVLETYLRKFIKANAGVPNVVGLRKNIAYSGPDMAHFITVKILSYDSNPIDACITICSVLDISEKQLLWRRKDLSMPRWRLVQLDDNGNEFEMFQFMDRSSAEWSMNKFDSKGHKQKYIIKEKTEPGS